LENSVLPGIIRFWLVMSWQAEGEAIYLDNALIRDCFVAVLLAMTGRDYSQ
jgi:hypothetical protein